MVHCTIGCMVLCTCLYAIHHRPNGVRELVAVHRQLCVRRWKTLLFGIPFVVFLLLFLIISNIFRSASFYFILDPILVAPYARSLCVVFYCFGVRSYFWKYFCSFFLERSVAPDKVRINPSYFYVSILFPYDISCIPYSVGVSTAPAKAVIVFH